MAGGDLGHRRARPADGALATISAEVATLARALGRGGRARSSVGRRRGRPGAPPRRSSPRYLPRVLDDRPSRRPRTTPLADGRRRAARRARRPTHEPDVVLVGAGPDGRDLAGALSALTGLGRPGQRDRASPGTDGGPAVEMSVFGGKLHHDVRLHDGPRDRHRPPQRRDRRAGRRRRARVEPARRRAAATGRSPPSRSSTASPRPAPPPRSRRPGSSWPAVAGSAAPEGFALVARARRGARRGRRGDASRRRFGLDPVQPADRPDRQDRQARSCTSRSASAARSSTRSGCRRRARSWRSTATRTRRSPTSRTCSWSATCSRSARRSLERAPRPVGLSGRERARRWNSPSCCRSRRSSPWRRVSPSSCRGTGRIVARTREVEGFRRAVEDLAARVDASLDGAAGRSMRSAADSVAAGRRSATRSPPRPTRSGATRTRRARSAGRAGRRRIRDDIVARARACRAGARHGRARCDDPGRRPPRPRELEAQTVDQARLPQPAPRPRGDRPPRRRAAELDRPPEALRPPPGRRPGARSAIAGRRPHHLVVSCRHTTIPSGRTRQESDALPPMRERETRVVDSRDLDDSATIRRRRECASCATRFTTYERVEAARLSSSSAMASRQEFDRASSSPGCARR